MKSKKMLVMICAFAAIIGVFALVNAKEKPIEYSREELAELFEKYLYLCYARNSMRRR